MADRKFMRGAIVEFDFTAIDGAQLLFDTAKRVLAGHGVELTPKLEALHLAGGNYQGALNELFAATGAEADAAATAQELSSAFIEALEAKVASGVTPGFRAFAERLAASGVKTVVATRANPEILRPALEGLDPDLVVPYGEVSGTYGNCKWDVWRRACGANDLHEILSAAVTGSGAGVKSALVAGLSAAAVVHDHVAYQDFGGADVVASGFDAALADEIRRMLHLA